MKNWITTILFLGLTSSALAEISGANSSCHSLNSLEEGRVNVDGSFSDWNSLSSSEKHCLSGIQFGGELSVSLSQVCVARSGSQLYILLDWASPQSQHLEGSLSDLRQYQIFLGVAGVPGFRSFDLNRNGGEDEGDRWITASRQAFQILLQNSWKAPAPVVGLGKKQRALLLAQKSQSSRPENLFTEISHYSYEQSRSGVNSFQRFGQVITTPMLFALDGTTPEKSRKLELSLPLQSLLMHAPGSTQLSFVVREGGLKNLREDALSPQFDLCLRK